LTSPATPTPSFGLLLPTREIVMTQERPDFQEIIELAEAAEALGFDAVWVGDSITARPRFEPLTTLAAVAARTRRVTVGTAVLLSALRQPVVLANEIANVDIISQGRLILGLGIAENNRLNELEFQACGVRFDRRISLFEEGLEIMTRLWSEPEVSFKGRNFELENVRLGLKPAQAKIPIWLAGREEPTFRRVVRFGDAWFPLVPSPEVFARGWSALQAVGRDMGRDLSTMTTAVYVTVNLNDDAAQGESEVRTFFEGYYNAPYEGLTRIHAAFAGPSEGAIAWLRAFVEAGANHLCVRFIGDQTAQLERFSREVMPRVRGT
jgi:probable F420-dependent oxidoreductase